MKPFDKEAFKGLGSFPFERWLGAGVSKLPPFEPFGRLSADFRKLSTDPFAEKDLGEGLKVRLFKSRIEEERFSAVLLRGEARIGFVGRHPAGCDLLAVAPDERGKGLASKMLRAAVELRVRLIPEGLSEDAALRRLYNGGSYSEAGLGCLRQAVRESEAEFAASSKPARPKP